MCSRSGWIDLRAEAVDVMNRLVNVGVVDDALVNEERSLGEARLKRLSTQRKAGRWEYRLLVVMTMEDARRFAMQGEKITVWSIRRGVT